MRILVPIDFSANDGTLFEAARQLASYGPTSVTLMHVFEPPAVPATEAPMVEAMFALNDQLISDCREQLSAAALHPSLAGLDVSHVLISEPLQGSAEEVADYAAKHRFDLVLALAKRRTKLDRFLEGTSLLRLLRHTTVPVLTLHPERMPIVQRVVYATDFSTDSAIVLQQMAPLIARFGASLTLARIYTRQAFETTREFRQHLRDFHDQLAQADLEAFRLIHESVAYYAEDLVQGIQQCADDHLADLIVLATHGRKGLSLLLSGSVTEEVVERSTLPVLIYRLPEA
jgi:nucleotide-binding universal stress UspA family protein